MKNINLKKIYLYLIIMLLNPLTAKPPQKDIKDFNFMVYITSNNNLHPYSLKNITEMKQIGSNQNINILVQQDVYGKKECKRIFIEKNKENIIETISNTIEAVSGTSENLYSFAKWAITNYPARHHALILWDHGSGIIDPDIWKKYFNNDKGIVNDRKISTGFYLGSCGFVLSN